jgi:hypothetical protein
LLVWLYRVAEVSVAVPHLEGVSLFVLDGIVAGCVTAVNQK